MSYSFYLFGKLFDAFYGIDCAYDILFEEVLRMYEDYVKSEYNDEFIGEYECMVNYLTAHKPMILAD
jgi:hypothetical protein